MENDDFTLTKSLGLIVLGVGAFMSVVLLALTRGGSGPFRFVFPALVIAVCVPLFLLFFVVDLLAARLKYRGLLRSAVLESVEPAEGGGGVHLLRLRREDNGELIERKLREPLPDALPGRRLDIVVDPRIRGNCRVLLTAADRAEFAHLFQEEKAEKDEPYRGPLNDALLMQEAEEREARGKDGEELS